MVLAVGARSCRRAGALLERGRRPPSPQSQQRQHVAELAADETGAGGAGAAGGLASPLIPTGRRFQSTTAPRPTPSDLSFSFSGAGFLAPFHLGCIKALLGKGIITERTKLAGASAGSLVAASTILGLSPEEQLEAYKKMAHACRASGGFAGRVEPVLARSLQERFPKDAHEICHGRLTVALMRLWPNPRLAPVLIDRFDSRQDLIDALLTSSHVPLYLDATQPLWRRFRGGLYADGGLSDLVPPVPDAIKICVFPPSLLLRSDLHVHPHLVNVTRKGTGMAKAGFPFSIAQLMRWAFVAPADDADIEQLYALGQEAALEWLATGGIQEGRKIDVVESRTLEDDKGRRVVRADAATMAAAAGSGTGGPIKGTEDGPRGGG